MSKISQKSEDVKNSPIQKGVVVSNAMERTAVVEVVTLKTHPKYKKKIKDTKKYHVHDEKNSCEVGDTVFFQECRPMSKTKKWTLVDGQKKNPAVKSEDN